MECQQGDEYELDVSIGIIVQSAIGQLECQQGDEYEPHVSIGIIVQSASCLFAVLI